MIKFENINMKFNEKELYKNFEIEFKENSINFLMGNSGVGKTTLLNIIVKKLLDKGENISVVFQENRLIPWKTVYKNLEVIIMNKYDECERKTKIDEALKSVGLEEYKNYYPNQLSGGMKQRINIVRALIYDGSILIMDEPFKALDSKCKNKMMNLVKNSIEKNNKTAIIVTHDYSEFEEIGDNIIKLVGEPVNIEM